MFEAVEIRRLVAERDPTLRFQSVSTLVLAASIQAERRHYDGACAFAEQAQKVYCAATVEQRRELGPSYSFEMLNDLLTQIRDGRS